MLFHLRIHVHGKRGTCEAVDDLNFSSCVTPPSNSLLIVPSFHFKTERGERPFHFEVLEHSFPLTKNDGWTSLFRNFSISQKFSVHEVTGSWILDHILHTDVVGILFLSYLTFHTTQIFCKLSDDSKQIIDNSAQFTRFVFSCISSLMYWE